MRTWAKVLCGFGAVYAGGAAVTAVVSKRAFPAGGAADLATSAAIWPVTALNLWRNRAVYFPRADELRAAPGTSVRNDGTTRNVSDAGVNAGRDLRAALGRSMPVPAVNPDGKLNLDLPGDVKTSLLNTTPGLRIFFS